MFMNDKIKTTVAAVSAAATIMVNTIVSVAAPYGYSNADSIRVKALGEYQAADVTVSLVHSNLPAANAVKKLISADAIVAYNEVSEVQEVAYNTVKRQNSSLEAGATVTVREGVPGQKTVKYKVKYEDGAEVSRTVIEECVTQAPVDKIVEYGSTAVQPEAAPAKGFEYKYVIQCEATAYDLSAEENGGYAGQTATGVPLDKGVIAVDPKVIPLGSRVYIEALDGSWSYGYAVAADTGGAIKGKRVDLCYRTQYECIQFGRRQCRVYVLS